MTIEAVQRARQSAGLIPAEDVRRWMADDDPEVQEEVSALVCSDSLQRVSPRLDIDTVCAFMAKYFRRAITELDDRYISAHELNLWFKALWRDPCVPRQRLAELKSMLADLYRHGPEGIRLCVVQGTVEHLFEDPEIAAYFDDWKEDPVLVQAFNQAAEWGMPRWPMGDRTGGAGFE